MQGIMFWLQPFIAAFTGWFTTWIALYMLFHPKNPIRLFGITIQGIFPKRQKIFAAKLGAVVANELLHFDEIAVHIKNTEQLAAIRPDIEKHIDIYLRHKLKEKMPVISTFIGEGTLQKLKEGLLEEIDVLLPEVIGKYTDQLSKKVDIEKMVTQKVENFSSDKLEEILASVMKKEFRFVEIVGGVLGFIIGLIQMGLSYL